MTPPGSAGRPSFAAQTHGPWHQVFLADSDIPAMKRLRFLPFIRVEVPASAPRFDTDRHGLGLERRTQHG